MSSQTLRNLHVAPLDECQRFLCDALAFGAIADRQKDIAIRYDLFDDRQLFDLAESNRIAPIVSHALMDALGRGHIPDHWRKAHEETYRRISAYLAELDRIVARLAGEGIPSVALKNGGIARGIYPCPGCCPMGDLDTLVKKRHFRQAHYLLLDQGYCFAFRSPLENVDLECAERNGGGEYWKTLLNGETLWLELQWRPVAGRWIRPDQEPPAEELIGRSLRIPGTDVRILAPEDNLLQVTLHTAKHSYVRAPGIRLHLDVERIVRYQTINWDLFLSGALSMRVRTAVFFSLLIPKVLFQTPIPDEVLSRLKPPNWKEHLISRWLEKVGLFNPHHQKFSRIGFILFTALLYDDARGMWRGMFPGRNWMRERYSLRSNLLLPYYHGRRLADLMFRRMNT